MNAIEKIKIDWEDKSTEERMIEILHGWVKNFLRHNDGTPRDEMVSLGYTLMRRAALKRAMKCKNSIANGMEKWTYKTNEILNKLNTMHKRISKMKEAVLCGLSPFCLLLPHTG